MKEILKMLAPCVAVLIFWCGLRNAWATLIACHLQILVWSRGDLRRVLGGWNPSWFLIVALPCILAGPIAYRCLPFMTRVPIQSWLAAYGLSGTALWIMVPYWGLFHPFLEQAHWGLCARIPASVPWPISCLRATMSW